MNTILEGPCRSMPFYTHLDVVFKALGEKATSFNWLITDLEFSNLNGVELPPELTLRFDGTTFDFLDVIWLPGKRLVEIVESCSLQFVWAVLSGFDTHIDIDPNNLEVHPFADGNPGFWRTDVAIQHPRASVEIVCWDSTCTLLISKDDDLSMRFRSFFPEARDLEAYNRGRDIEPPAFP